MPRPHFIPGKGPVPILQEAGWVPGPVRTGGKSSPHRDLILDRPARSQSLYWLSCHTECLKVPKNDPNVNTHFIKSTPLIVTLLASSRYVHFCTVISKNMDCQVLAAKFEGMKAWQQSATVISYYGVPCLVLTHRTQFKPIKGCRWSKLCTVSPYAMLSPSLSVSLSFETKEMFSSSCMCLSD